jgi:hypothetical protein
MRRRTLLKALGASATLLPFVPLLSASAEENVVPRRVLFFYTSCGTVYPQWKPGGGVQDFVLEKILQPLEPFRDRLLILDGLDYATGGAGSRHFQGPHKFLAGSKLLAGDEFTATSGAKSGWGSHISVDQHIAKAVASETPFASLEFGVNIDLTDPRSRMSFRKSNDPVTPEDNPYKMFDRVFADAGKSAEEIARLRKRRQSVIDTVRGQLEQVAARSSAEDGIKLDAHLEGLRSIEKRLATAGGVCEVPTVGAPVDHHKTANFPIVSRLQLDIMAAALACDMTRVASLMWSRETSPQSLPWLGFNDRHHLLSHAGDSDTASQNKLVKINAYYAGELAYLMEKLDSYPEGDGTTLLDNTLIVWGNGLGKGNAHTQTRIPFVLAGGAQGYFRMGRSLTYESRLHNRLLVSICHYMGLEGQQTFGNLDGGSGPLNKLV